MAQRELYPQDLPLKILDRAKSPETERYNIVVATDLEGPLLLGDTSLKAMSTYVRPEHGNPKIDYGSILFGETYNWFMEKFYNNVSGQLGQEGSDIVLALPSLLAIGVTNNNLLELARTSRKTPGSKEYINFLKSQGALVVGITTAWEKPHREIVLEELGLDGIIGTDFSLDDAKVKLSESEQMEIEMQMTRDFLSDCFQVITDRETCNENTKKDRLTHNLHQRIQHFFVGELGITWDQNGRIVSTQDKFITELGAIMASYNVIGDKGKAEVAKILFSKYASAGAPQIAIGDGYNDIRMLNQSPWSIGINGAKATEAAKIGVIANNVQILSELIKLIQKFPEPTDENVRKVVTIARLRYGDKAIVHLGGKFGTLSPRLLAMHQIGKREMRREAALLP